MKTFLTYINEKKSSTSSSVKSSVAQSKERQAREKDDEARVKDANKTKYARELERSRFQDFTKKSQERKALETKKKFSRLKEGEDCTPAKDSLEVDLNVVNEYLEDGTDELVDTYKKNVPGQD